MEASTYRRRSKARQEAVAIGPQPRELPAQLIQRQTRQVHALSRLVHGLREQTHEHANQLHYIWVPCVPNETQYYAEFELINDNDAVALAADRSRREECRELEE